MTRWLFSWRVSIDGGRARLPEWAGGIALFTSRMQYSALAYSNPVRVIFNGLYRSRHQTELISPGARHLDGRIGYTQTVPEPLERELYRPLRETADWLSRRARRLQSGSVNHYVAYIFAIVLVVLLLRLL